MVKKRIYNGKSRMPPGFFFFQNFYISSVSHKKLYLILSDICNIPRAYTRWLLYEYRTEPDPGTLNLGLEPYNGSDNRILPVRNPIHSKC